ncbi:MAG TPA: bifunctional riboflavin kinase/FAD synthetase [Polyangiaceae bacterium]|nr:bifunctional riboflavin kinase/FAD synthetase [Polyangiaceae bacterium]
MSERATLVAIGNFDGVHCGHAAVLKPAASLAKERGLAPVVLTFDPHPAGVLGRQVLPALTALPRKCELIERLGLTVHVAQFTRELAQLSPRQFAEQLLVERLKAKHVIVGQNFRFGRERSGDFAELATLGEQMGFSASAQPLLRASDEIISSSVVRRAIVAGDLVEAKKLLGRPHSFSGEVVTGEGRGRTLGVPTANLAGVVEVLPSFGVYAVLVDRLALDEATGRLAPKRLGQGALNLGVRPTFGGGAPSVEVHLLDFSGDLYGQRLRLHLIKRLRPEQKFASVHELMQQIERDISQARAALDGISSDPAAGAAWY